jgi:hypothetical protein
LAALGKFGERVIDVKTKVVVMVLIVAAGIGGLIIAYLSFHPHRVDDHQSTDPLCSYVSSSQLRCVAVLGSDALLGPGALVDYPTNATPQTPVPLPNAELFSSACLVPGEKADALQQLFRQQEQENSVNLPAQTYDFQRSFQAGVSLPVPRLYNLNLKAGPNASQLQKVTFRANHAWFKYIDENVLLDLLASAGIKQSCIDHLIQSKYSVIAKALIAKDLAYEFTDKSGQSYTFSAAAQKGEIQWNTGGSTTMDLNQAAQILASTPVVLGVAFLNPTVLQEQKTKLQTPVVFSSTGHAEVLATGVGGQGALAQVADQKPTGAIATAAASGQERSECNSNKDLTVSMADLNAHVRTPAPNSIAITGAGTIRGGHYATGNCVLGQLVNLSGHDTGVTGRYAFTGMTRATVRFENATLLRVQFTGLPSGSSIEVHDPEGRALNANAINQPVATVAGDGALDYKINGAGVYLVSLISTVTQVVNGAGSVQMSTSGNMSVSVH